MSPPRLLIALALFVVLGGAAGAAAGPSKPTLRVRVTGGGRVVTNDRRINCGRKCFTTLRRGAVRELTALPRDYFAFVAWRGACLGQAPGCLVAVDRSTKVGAEFKRMTGFVDLTVTGPGEISVEPTGGTARGTTSRFEALQGTTVRLVPRADAGAQLKGWGKACAGQPLDGCTLLVQGQHTVTAAFGQTPPGEGMRTLTVGVGGVLVHSTPPGISCPPACQADFPAGTVVTLDVADERTEHVWQDACTGSGPSCMLVLDTPLQVGVYAFYNEGPANEDVRVTVSGPGRVTDGDVGVKCGQGATRCQQTFPPGYPVTLHAFPSGTARFVGWGGRCLGTDPVCELGPYPGQTNAWALFRSRARSGR